MKRSSGQTVFSRIEKLRPVRLEKFIRNIVVEVKAGYETNN